MVHDGLTTSMVHDEFYILFKNFLQIINRTAVLLKQRFRRGIAVKDSGTKSVPKALFYWRSCAGTEASTALNKVDASAEYILGSLSMILKKMLF